MREGTARRKMPPYIVVNLEKLFLKYDFSTKQKLQCNLKLINQVFLFSNASKGTRKAVHSSRHCGVAQGMNIKSS